MDLSPMQRAERLLGKAVHPKAIHRLFELWPEAEVSVEHTKGRHDGVDLRVTGVVIWEGPGRMGTSRIGSARCRLDQDQWNRHFGIRLAFGRALKQVPR